MEDKGGNSARATGGHHDALASRMSLELDEHSARASSSCEASNTHHHHNHRRRNHHSNNRFHRRRRQTMPPISGGGGGGGDDDKHLRSPTSPAGHVGQQKGRQLHRTTTKRRRGERLVCSRWTAPGARWPPPPTLRHIPLVVMLIILATLGQSQPSSGLDSPVRIQRNKLQQQQQQLQAGNSTAAISAGGLQHDDNFSSLDAPLAQPAPSGPQDSQTQRQQQQQQTVIATSFGSAPNHNKVDRVRRTNGEQAARAAECPANKLVQALLPPEYAGSPAASQRPSMARAHCECLPDPFGWHVTCFAGSAPFASSSATSASGGGGGAEAPMPNQLHPAFRSSQVARQQQQQQQAASLQLQGRRLRRSPWARWLGAEHEEASRPAAAAASPAHAASSGQHGDEPAPHEGFGEEASPGQQQQQQAPQQPHQANASAAPDKPAPFHKHLSHSSSKSNSSSSGALSAPWERRQQAAARQPDEAAAGGEQLARPAGDRLMQAASSSHLAFQTVPVLFGVKYLRNNMIEIDCDQAAPNYKAAMFRGFNVNEIAAFTFNNCQLPSIPFSVLLHRPVNAVAARNAEPAGGASRPAAQALKPAGRAGVNLVRKRRRSAANEEPPEVAPPSEEASESSRARAHEPKLQWQQARQAPALPMSGEPRVKSLIINLNAVVDQRTLISSLTGLDLLEDLQLNYMQLNLTNFLNDLHLAPTAAQSATATPATSSSLRATPPADELIAAANAPSQQQRVSSSTTQAAPPSGGSLQAQTGAAMSARPPSSLTGSSTLASTTTTSTSTTSTSTTTSTTSTTSTTTTTTTTTTTPAPTTVNVNFANLRPFKKQQATTLTTSSSTSSTSSLTSGQTRPIHMSSSSTKPSISMGAPRGLVIAQATGVPPLASSSGSGQQTTVPTISLQTVVSSIQASPTTSSTQQQQQQPPATTTIARQQPAPPTTTAATSTTAVGPGQRQPLAAAAPSTASQLQNVNMISIGSSQSHSVSYTSQSTPAARAQTTTTGMFHLAPAPTTTSSSTSSTSGASQPNTSQRAPLTSSALMSTSSSSSSSSSSPSSAFPAPTTTTGHHHHQAADAHQTLPASRLHQSPSAWFAAGGSQTAPTTPLAAGSRLSIGAGSGAPTTTTTSASSGSDAMSGSSQPSSSSSASSPFSWSASSIQTPAASTTTIASGPSSTLGLNAPVNTPPFTAQPPPFSGGNFGFRTSNQNAAFRTTGAGGSGGQLQGRRQQLQTASAEPTMTARQSTPEGPFVAAGGRLHQAANHQRRLHPAGATTAAQQAQNNNNNNNNGNQRFSSAFASSPASAFVDEPEAPSSEEEFVLNGGGVASGAHDSSPAVGADENASNEATEGEAGDLISADSERLGRAARNRRWAPQAGASAAATTTQAVAFEEFELSFGDILPNLRSLKLESFIDLSSIVADGRQQNQAARRRPQHSGRFKRQFQPADVPERDEPGGDADQDTMLAEESNFHHNSVMAPGGGQPAADGVSARRAQPAASDDEADEAADDRQPDIEPGETLWRSASNTDSRAAAANDSRDEAGEDSERDAEAEGRTVARLRPPASFQPGEVGSQPPAAAPLDPLDGAAAGADFSSPLEPTQARVRQLSALVLNKLFARLSKLKTLQLVSNDIPYWPDHVLQDAQHSLVRLYLISNNLRQLGARSLAHLSELQTLDLSSNQLRQLPADQLRDLVSLRQLRATRNLFRKLPLKLIARQQAQSNASSSGKPAALAKLESVDFGKNRYLSQLSWLEGQPLVASGQFAPLTSLNLTDCALTDQFIVTSSSQGASSPPAAGPSALFASLASLTSISLQNNKFRELLATASLFAKNRQLARLDLGHNQLQRLSNHLFNANASSLAELRLNHNQLAEVPEQFLFNLRRLRHLTLAHNRLRQLPAKMFLTNQLLESLDLSHNQLVTLNTRLSGQIPFGNGANLRHLQLAHNNLSHFEADIFDIAWSFYTNLNSLDLAHNKFSGQIQMPIFYTIRDEMQLSLSSNLIQSVSVEALVQHEQVLDRYATAFESLNSTPELGDADEGGAPALVGRRSQLTANSNNEHSAAAGRAPAVTIRLANNPLACDCLLEPLISYTRRVAAATNPALLATLFPARAGAARASGQQPADHHRHQEAADSASRYSVLGAGESGNNKQMAATTAPAARQAQVLYQFKFNDLHCNTPANLQRRALSHISIGDLLCPVQDARLCPAKCDCHYQSAFKTVIVDCNGRKLAQVPAQLTDAANFHQFELESAFNISGANGLANNRQTISSVDKIIIRLDNNRLTSMDQLARLFSVVSQAAGGGGGEQAPPMGDGNALGAPANLRFARAPSSSAAAAEHLAHAESSPYEHDYAPPSPQQQQQQQQQQVKKISPAEMARKSMRMASEENLQRQRRQTTLPATSSAGDGSSEGPPPPPEVEEQQPGASSGADQLAGPSSAATHLPLSTAVLESAEEFRTRRYSQLTCELYLDHNLISELPESFLAALDQVRASAVQPTQTPPQAALPSAMLEPPIHTKLSHADLMGGPAAGSDPMRASATSLHAASASALSSSGDTGGGGGGAESPQDQLEAPRVRESSLFGRQPFAAEKKAALMETISQNVRLNKLQAEANGGLTANQQQQQRVSVSPSLVVLSLRYNNLANVNARLLDRLGKLIKSSNTKLYLGHNPFNCSDSRAQEEKLSEAERPGGLYAEGNVLATPMGDQLLAASDSLSGARLEPAPDDLATAASGEAAATSAAGDFQQPLTPSDCPVGQLKTWLTRHHAHVGDLDELYCVHMPAELADKLRLANATQPAGAQRLRARHAMAASSSAATNNKWDHDHPWTSSLMSSALANGGGGGGDYFKLVNNSQLHKAGVSWNAELLASTAKLIDVDLYDMCPYSNVQPLDAAALGYLSAASQRALISLAILLVLISLLLLLMLIYFGDTQTILAFVYIHLNPVYNCLRLNEGHLDGEKLYDAFVSYSSADRDLVMELIERLEQAGGQPAADGKLLGASKGAANLDNSRDALVHENVGLGTLQRRSTSTLGASGGALGQSFQDLSTMSRSTSRAGLNGPSESAANLTPGARQADRFEQAGNINTSNSSTLALNQSTATLTREHDLKATAAAAAANRPYRLCIHERDWLPGHLISWNIVNSVQNSRRTILVLSKEFIKSVWFQVEFHTAYYQMLEDKIDRLIVIVRGELPPKHELDKNLAFLLTTKTYLTWGEKWFWERLHYALPHRAGPARALMKSPVKQPTPAVATKHNKLRHNNNNNNNKHNTPTRPLKASAGSAASMLSSLAAGHADPPQKPLVMSAIGRDCGNLLLPAGQQAAAAAASRLGQQANGCSSSSSSTSSQPIGGGGGGGAANARSASASSFLSGSSCSTNQLFKPPAAESNNQTTMMMMTTSNDLLSSPIANKASGNTTRLSIGGAAGGGGPFGMRSSSPLATDSGRITAERLSSSQLSIGQQTSGNITSILLEGNGQQPAGASSKLRAQKQERLQSFVDKEISNHFNLSEL